MARILTYLIPRLFSLIFQYIYTSALFLHTLLKLKYAMAESLTNEVVVSYSRRRRSALLFSSVSSLVVVLLQMLLGGDHLFIIQSLQSPSSTPETGSRRLMQGDVRSMYPGGERRSDRNS